MNIDVTVADRIATVTISRPPKLKALDYQTMYEHRALVAFETDARLRVVILTGTGNRALSASANMGSLAEGIRSGTEQAFREAHLWAGPSRLPAIPMAAGDLIRQLDNARQAAARLKRLGLDRADSEEGDLL